MFFGDKKSKNDFLTLLKGKNNLNNNFDMIKEKRASIKIFSSIKRKINNKSQEKKINNRLNDILKKYFNCNFRNSIENLSPTNLINNDKNSYYHSDNSSNL